MKLWVFTITCFASLLVYPILNITGSLIFIYLCKNSPTAREDVVVTRNTTTFYIVDVCPSIEYYYLLFQFLSSLASSFILIFMAIIFGRFLRYRTMYEAEDIFFCDPSVYKSFTEHQGITIDQMKFEI
jgi:hypothetical protein